MSSSQQQQRSDDAPADSATFTMAGSISAASDPSILLDKYDGFILDQFGVIHNGVTALPGAVDCATTLATKHNKKLIILSNSSAMSSTTLDRLPKYGFDRSHFIGAVTSGDECVKYLQRERQRQTAIMWTWRMPKKPSPLQFLEACGDLTLTTDVDKADFLLLHGCEVMLSPSTEKSSSSGDSENDHIVEGYSQTSLGDYMEGGDMTTFIIPMLEKCRARDLPLICANPDFIYVRPDGTTANMPGTIAQHYRDVMGGTVIEFGKPHREHFEACVEALQLPADKIVHVGDSLHHDIVGANAANIDSIFIVGGVHRQELIDEADGVGADNDNDINALPSREALEALFTKHGTTPTHVLPMFKM